MQIFPTSQSSRRRHRYYLPEYSSQKITNKINLSFDHTSFEAAEFSIDQGYNFFQVICIYRPPYSGSNKLSPAVFINEFEQLLCSLSSKIRHTIILGDFNLHFDSDSSNDVNRMKDLITQCSMEQLISNSTHRAGHILDWVVVKKDCKTVDNIAVLDHLLSNHCSIIIDFIIIIRCQIWNRHWRPCLSKHLCHQTTSKNLNPYFVHLLPSYKDYQEMLFFVCPYRLRCEKSNSYQSLHNIQELERHRHRPAEIQS